MIKIKFNIIWQPAGCFEAHLLIKDATYPRSCVRWAALYSLKHLDCNLIRWYNWNIDLLGIF